MLTSFTDVSFQTTRRSFKPSSCHAARHSPTFLYGINIFIIIKIIYYYKLLLLYINNVRRRAIYTLNNSTPAVTL